MFKQGSFETEIRSSMESNLRDKALESKFAFSKLSRAADHLSHAAELFERAGMTKEAEEALGLLNKLAVAMTQRVLP